MKNKLYATTTCTEDIPGIKISMRCTQMQEIEATCESLNRYTDEWLRTPFYRFSKRRELVEMIIRASEHLEKVLHVYNYANT